MNLEIVEQSAVVLFLRVNAALDDCFAIIGFIQRDSENGFRFPILQLESWKIELSFKFVI